MDALKLEVDSMAKAHQSIAGQMKTELEEPLTAFAGMIRERRKFVQGGCEKILKLKMQQTQQVNKVIRLIQSLEADSANLQQTRDRYEQDCLKIKGYLAQGHMVMGQEERKNKARLEKTQAALAGSNAEYEAAIKALEETTVRWNRDWKAACDVCLESLATGAVTNVFLGRNSKTSKRRELSFSGLVCGPLQMCRPQSVFMMMR